MCDRLHLAMFHKKKGVFGMSLPELMTIEEVMDYLNLSHTSVYTLLRNGDLKGVKVGREWRVKKEDMLAYINRGEPANG